LRPAPLHPCFARSKYHASGVNNSDEESHVIASQAVAMVIEATKTSSTAPNNGDPVFNPFDDPGSALKDPRTFFYGTHEEIIPCVLYAWALSAEYDNLRARLAKYVDEDNCLAGEAGLDEEGYAVVPPGATVKTDTTKKRKAAAEDGSSSLADSFRASTSTLADALRSLAPPPASAEQTEMGALSAQIAAASALCNELTTRRTSVMTQMQQMRDDSLFTDEDRAGLRSEFNEIRAALEKAQLEMARAQAAKSALCR